MGSQFGLPEVRDVVLDQGFELSFGRLITKEEEGVGEVVSEAECSNLGKPVLVALASCGKQLFSNVVEDTARKSTDHPK